MTLSVGSLEECFKENEKYQNQNKNVNILMWRPDHSRYDKQVIKQDRDNFEVLMPPKDEYLEDPEDQEDEVVDEGQYEDMINDDEEDYQDGEYEVAEEEYYQEPNSLVYNNISDSKTEKIITFIKFNIFKICFILAILVILIPYLIRKYRK